MTQKAAPKLEESGHLAWDDIPKWQQDNEYILSGYRPPSGSYAECLQSLLQIHNETVNIHTHLIGALIFFTLPLILYNHVYFHDATPADFIVFSTFFFGVAICFLLSATFHIISNHSPRVNVLGNQLDYLGVVILMWGSTIPSVYYGYYCDPTLQKLYWTMVTALAIACATTTLHPSFRTPALRPYRATMYAGLGLSFLVPMIHGLILYGWETQDYRMSLRWMGLMTTLNFIGAATYAARVPERWYPKKYDICGAGHQILHVMVILAGMAHMAGLMQAYQHAHAQTVPCPAKHP